MWGVFGSYLDAVVEEDHKYQEKAHGKTTLTPYILLLTEQHKGSITEPLFQKEPSRIEVSVILSKIKPP